MKSGSLCVVALIGLVWAAAGHAASVSIPPEGEADYPQTPVVVPQTSRSIDPKSAIAHWRQIGLRSKATDRCPTVDGWAVESLLSRALSSTNCGPETLDPQGPSEAALREELTDLALLRKLGLDRICLYTADPRNIPAFKKDGKLPADLVAAAPDRMALAPAATPEASLGTLALESWQILRTHFLEQAGNTFDPANRLRFTGKPSVRLVFLDTHPTGERVPSGPGRSFHGYTLAHLANQLICGGEAGCAVEIDTRLAMPYVNFDESSADEERGGKMGLVANLSAAILEEVWQWRRDRDPDRPKHLVLNLSLGWDGELFGDLNAQTVSRLEPGVRAVYDALTFARDLGVLVVAAAGNERGGPAKPSSPLFPAVWELHRPASGPFASCRKPIYAVGGVDWQGLPVANARTDGKPRRSAYADHAVTGTEARGAESPTWIYTGTSVGAAVTSSIAAAVWHLRPELGPGQVMRLIDRSGESLEARADFYPWQRNPLLRWIRGEPRLRRVSLCRATALARGRGPECFCPKWRREPPVLARPMPPPATDFVESDPEAYGQRCTSTRRLMVNDNLLPKEICPAERFGDIASQRWTFPQPEDNPCMGCALIPPRETATFPEPEGPPPYTLQMALRPGWRDEGAEILAATLDIERFEGDRMTYVISQEHIDRLNDRDPIPTGTSIQLLFSLADRGSLWGCTARLNFKVRRGDEVTSIIDPVIVDP